MKITNKKEMSYWAYHQCRKGNDIEYIRELITDRFYVNLYCLSIDNRKDIRERINVKGWESAYKRLCKLEELERRINEINR